jgi:oxygen-dependent protoporphyrinogen oxidase
VVGAGISGLAAALRVRSELPDADVVVLEASPHVGGKLRRVEVAGTSIDVGAEAMLARRPEGLALASSLGLDSGRIYPSTLSALIRIREGNRPLPARTLLGIPADLAALSESGVLTDDGLARVTREPDLPPLDPIVEDVAIGELVASRFGSEVVDRLTEPLLGGVYAGHSRNISLQAAAPALAAELAAHGGSLLHAVRATMPSPSAIPEPVFASFQGGLAVLAEAAADLLDVRTRVTVRDIRRQGDGFVLALGAAGRSEFLMADAVIVAAPAHKASVMLSELAPVASRELAAIETASVAIVTLAFDSAGDGRAPLTLPPGSGVLVATDAGVSVKGMTFSSQKWPLGHGAPVLLRASLGRAREEWQLQCEDAELVDVARADLASITGVRAEPIDTHVQRWGGGLPQYAVGHPDRVRRIREDVSRISGLAVCGASYDGIGIPACVASATSAADQVLAGLRRAAE